MDKDKLITTYQPPSIEWSCPSTDSKGSMPLGNGDVAINAWIEKKDYPDFYTLYMYISKNDAWDNNGNLIKLGKVKIQFKPAHLTAISNDASIQSTQKTTQNGIADQEKDSSTATSQPNTQEAFNQTLDTMNGIITCTIKNIHTKNTPATNKHTKKNSEEVSLRLWVDSHANAIQLQGDSTIPLVVDVQLEPWRTQKRALDKKESMQAIGLSNANEQEWEYPDCIFETATQDICWCHFNTTSVFTQNLEQQSLGHYKKNLADPLLHRCFGGIISAKGGKKQNPSHLRIPPTTQTIDIQIICLTTENQDMESWKTSLYATKERINQCTMNTRFEDHKKWWHAFWQRSWIHIQNYTDTSKLAQTNQGYALQRFLFACAGRGEFPIKFNGSLFTVDNPVPGYPNSPDYRQWGGGYWFQNTRLIYWSMLASGDFDLMKPFFQMYANALPLAMERTQRYFQHEGAYFPETLTFWGTYLNGNYGYDRTHASPGEIENNYIRYYFQGILELSVLLLDYYDFTQNSLFLKETALPLIEQFILFYEHHFNEYDDWDHKIYKPMTALETWHEAVNPLPDIAGMHDVLNRLLDLPDSLITQEDRKRWSAFLEHVPPIPKRYYVFEKRTELIPALQYDHCSNFENVPLYAVFPYRLYSYGTQDVEIGRETYKQRYYKRNGGWFQDAMYAAMLGFAEEAMEKIMESFSTKHELSRFPAFWGPNYDWVPDQDHGSVAMIALQRMLLQWKDKTIYLYPAWRKEWDVEFTLHGPGNTIIQSKLINGEVQALHIEPLQHEYQIQIAL